MSAESDGLVLPILSSEGTLSAASSAAEDLSDQENRQDSTSSLSDSDFSEMSHSPISLINPTNVRYLPPLVLLGDPVRDYRKILDDSPTTSLTSSASNNFDISDCDISDCDTLDDCYEGSSPSPSPQQLLLYLPAQHIPALSTSTYNSNLVRRQLETFDPSLRHEVATFDTPHVRHHVSVLEEGALSMSSETIVQSCEALSHIETYRPSNSGSGPCLRSAGSEPTPARDSGTLQRMSYVARALALARPTSPPPAYRTESRPTVLTLRSYFNFAQVGSRPHSAPNTCYSTRPTYDPGDMTNEPYTLQATHVIHQPQPSSPSASPRGSVHYSAYYSPSSPSDAIVPASPSGSIVPASRSGSSTVYPSNSADTLSPFARRRAEVSHSGPAATTTPPHRPAATTTPPHRPAATTTPPCSYHNRRGAVQELSSRYAYCCHGYRSNESGVSTPVIPALIIDTGVVTAEDALPPPYTAGDWISSIQAPRYSEVVNARYIRSSSFFHQHSAFSCMGSVRTLAIGITLCCCGVVFLMVTYVFGAVANTYLGYLGILQVIIGLTMILLVAIYNSGRCNFVNLVKRYRICPCITSEPSNTTC